MHRLYAQLLATSLLAVMILSWVSASPLFAQQDKSQTSKQKGEDNKTRVPATQAKPAPPRPALPNDEALLRLICSTVIALNQANATGNYSVFRELSAPGFQIANSTGQLSETFAKLRSRNFDLSAVVLLQPKLLAKPEIDRRSMLRLTGFFPTEPERLNFDLLYQFVGEQWRLFGIAIDTAAVNTTAQSGPQPSTSKSSSSAIGASSAGPDNKEDTPTAQQGDARDRVDLMEGAQVDVTR